MAPPKGPDIEGRDFMTPSEPAVDGLYRAGLLLDEFRRFSRGYLKLNALCPTRGGVLRESVLGV